MVFAAVDGVDWRGCGVVAERRGGAIEADDLLLVDALVWLGEDDGV